MAKKKTVVEVDYKVKGADKVEDAFDDVGKSAEGASEKTEKYNKSVEDTGKATEGAKSGLKGMLAGMKAIVMNPIGLVLTALAATVKFMSSAIAGSEESSNKLAAAFAYVKGFIQPVTNAFNDFVGGLGDGEEGAMNFVDTFKRLMTFWYEQTIAPPLNAVLIIFNTFENAILRVRKAWADFTGDDAMSKKLVKDIEESNEKIKENAQAFVTFAENIVDVVVVAADVVKKISEDGEDMLDAAIKKGREMAQSLLQLTLAEQELVKVRRKQEVENAKSLAQLEQLKVIRDDESKSLKERIEANKKISEVESNRVKQAISLSQRELKLMKRRGELEGFSTELLDSIKDKEIELADFRNENAGIRAEQIVNDVNLRKEQFEKEAALVDQQLQLDSVLEESAVKLANSKIEAEQKKLDKLKELGLQENQIFRDQQFNLQMAQEEAIKVSLELDKKAKEDKAKQKEIDDKAREDEIKERAQTADIYIGMASDLADTLATTKMDGIDKEQAALDKSLEDGIISEEEYNAKSKDLAVKANKIQRNAALAKIAVDTASAISSLVVASQGNPLNLLTAGAAGIAQFAAGILQIGTNMASATALLKSPAPQLDASTGGASGPAPTTEQTAPDLGFEGRSAGTENFGRQIPIRAYVTESEITTSQNTASNIQQLSQIG